MGLKAIALLRTKASVQARSAWFVDLQFPRDAYPCPVKLQPCGVTPMGSAEGRHPSRNGVPCLSESAAF